MDGRLALGTTLTGHFTSSIDLVWSGLVEYVLWMFGAWTRVKRGLKRILSREIR